MSNKRNKRIEAIYHLALEKKAGKERSAFLDSACEDDNDLRTSVESLLKAHDKAGDFLESPIIDSGVSLHESPLSEGPGTVIGRYKLLEKIGEGGMAVVYMAEQEKPIRRKVALKIIKLGMDTKQVIARFEAERQALAMMDHPNIAKVFDAGATETGRPYFVMELVTGFSITEFCDKKNLSTKERLELFMQVCNAVQHAHSKGIIHRDIKPSNIMITQHEGKPIPKVIDFGIAKATNQRLTEKTLFTRYAHIIGTPAYMSPEQAELSDFDIDTRSDIYSLGVLLYELLTGTTPFSEEQLRKAGYSKMQLIIKEEEPDKPSTKLSTLGQTLTDIAKHRSCTPDLLTKSIRGDLDWIVMKSLEKDRNRRYETASEFAHDIQRHLSNEPVTAGSPGIVYGAHKFVQRHRTSVAFGLVFMVSLIIGFSLATIGFVQAKQEQTRTKAALQRARMNFEIAIGAVEEMTLLAKEQMYGVPGMEQVQKDLLLKAQVFYQKFLQENRGELTVREDIGQAYMKLGDIHHMLGQYEQAEQTCRKSIKIFKELVTDLPNLPEYRKDLADSYNTMADVLTEIGQAEEAEHEYRQAIELLEKLVIEFPGEFWYKQTLANIYHSLGTLLEDAGQARQTEQNLDQARHLLGGLVAELSDDLGEKRKLMVAYRSLGEVLLDFDKLEEAVQAFQKAVEHQEQLTVDFQDQPDYQESLANNCTRLGDVLTATKQFEEAEQIYLRAIELREKLIKDFPTEPGYCDNLAYSYVQLGILYRKIDRLEEAEQAYREGIKIQEKVVTDFPAVPYYRSSLAHKRNVLTDLLRDTGRLEEAEDNIRDTIKLFKKLADDFPVVPEYRYNVAYEYGGFLADTLIERGSDRLQEVERILRQSEKLFKDLVADFPNVPIYRNALAYNYIRLISILRKSDRLEEAEQAYQNVLFVCEDTIKTNPENAQAYATRARIHTMCEHWDKALADFSRAIELDPNDANLLNNFAWFLATCPSAEIRDGTRAIEYANQACILTNWQEANIIDTLAAAYAETGDFKSAVEWQNKAIDLLQEDKSTEVRTGYESRLKLYQEGKPFTTGNNETTENPDTQINEIEEVPEENQ